MEDWKEKAFLGCCLTHHSIAPILQV
jgi:hypothetical protein